MINNYYLDRLSLNHLQLFHQIIGTQIKNTKPLILSLIIHPLYWFYLTQVLEHFYANYGGVWTGCFKFEKSSSCRGALAGQSIFILCFLVFCCVFWCFFVFFWSREWAIFDIFKELLTAALIRYWSILFYFILFYFILFLFCHFVLSLYFSMMYIVNCHNRSTVLCLSVYCK